MRSTKDLVLSKRVLKIIRDKHLLFDSDVLIDLNKYELGEDLLKLLEKKSIVPCITPLVKMEVFNNNQGSFDHDGQPVPNSKGDRHSLEKMQDLVSEFQILEIRKEDPDYWFKTQRLSRGLQKMPGIVDLHLASTLTCLPNMFLITGNLKDFSSELFERVGGMELYSSEYRKVMSILSPTMDRETLKEIH